MSFLETFAAGLFPVEREMKGETRLLRFIANHYKTHEICEVVDEGDPCVMAFVPVGYKI